MIIADGVNLVDVAIRAHGTVEALFDLAALNGIRITDPLSPGQGLRVDTGREYSPLPPARSQVATKPKPVTATVVSDGQNLVDIALQEYGSVEGLFALAQSNGLSATDGLNAGQPLAIDQVQTVKPQVAAWYRARGLRVNTGRTVPPVALPTQVEMVDWHPLDFIETDFY